MIPYSVLGSFVAKDPKDKYLCMRYSHEERILNEVLDTFKDAQYFNPDLK